jgi:WD and tetratricopeptide repeats protein 1
MSSRYTADYVREQLFVPPFHKVSAKGHAKQKKASVNTTSRSLSRVRKMGSPCHTISVSWSAIHIEPLCLLWLPFQVDMCKKFMQVATRSLETGKNLMLGIEACSEVLESMEPDIDDDTRHEFLCTRAALYLKVCLLPLSFVGALFHIKLGIIEFDLQRKWKNDVYMAIRDCNRTWKIDVTSYQAHLHMAEALLQVSISKSVRTTYGFTVK